MDLDEIEREGDIVPSEIPVPVEVPVEEPEYEEVPA